jgi:hypothetical protein
LVSATAVPASNSMAAAEARAMRIMGTSKQGTG